MKIAKKHLLKIELTAVFVLIPAIIAITRPMGLVLPLLWLMSALCWRILRDGGSSWRKEWNTAALTGPVMGVMMRRFIPFAILIAAFTCVLVPDRLFNFPLQNWRVWLIVMLVYPLMSVISQEIIFRGYFFKRYAPILTDLQLKIGSAAAFGWMHIILHNWIAVLFCTMGGWLFADTYRKTQSLAVVSLEHTLYGCYVFTIGLGAFFYHGNVGQ